MSDIYNINQVLENYLNSKRPIEKIQHDVEQILKTDIVQRIRPELINKIINKFPDLGQFLLEKKFKAIEMETGKTYGLFVNEAKKLGVCLLLKVSYDKSQNSGDALFKGSAESFRQEFNLAFDYVTKIIRNNLKDAFFYNGIKKYFEVKFLDQLNNTVTNLKLFGNSIKLPLAISIFSELMGEKIDTSIACTGNIAEDLRVTYVDGIEEKISAAVCEYPEIKKILLPSDCRSLNIENQIKEIEIVYVNNLEEALKIYFGDFKKLIAEKDFLGKIKIVDKLVALDNDDKAVLINFELNYNQSLHFEVLSEIQDIMTNIHSRWFEQQVRIFLLNNFRVNWLLASVMNIFVNKSEAVGVYYSDISNYVLVYTARSQSKYCLGQVVGIKSEIQS